LICERDGRAIKHPKRYRGAVEGAAASVIPTIIGTPEVAFNEIQRLASLTIQIFTVALLETVDPTVTTLGWNLAAGSGVELASVGTTKLAVDKALGHTGLTVQFHTVALLANPDNAVTTGATIAGIKLTVGGAGEPSPIKALANTIMAIQVRAVAFLSSADPTVAADDTGACIELAVNGATKLAPVEALGRTSLIVQIVTIAPLVTANLTVTTDETGACIELTSRCAAKITAVEALGRAGLTVKFLAIALLAIVDLAVTTVDQRHSATTSIELAGSSTAKITASETVISTGLTVQCLAITLLAIVDLAVTTVDRLQGATTGIEPTVSSTAKITAGEAVIRAGITVQCLAIALLAIVDLAVTTVDRLQDATTSIELAGSSTAKITASEAEIRAVMTVQCLAVTLLAIINLAVAAVGRRRSAAAGIELAGSSTSKITTSKALIHAGLTVQRLAITLFAIVNLAVAAVGRRRSAATGIELTGSSTSKLAPSKAPGNASLTVQLSPVTLLVTLDLAIAKHCIVVTATATQRNQCTHQHKHWHQAPF